MKTCTKCNIEKAKTEFRCARPTNSRVRSACKLCCNAESKIWRENNKDKVFDSAKAWREANAEKRAKANKEWYEANPWKYSEYRRKRRALNLISEGSHSAADVRSIFESQSGLCATCETKLFKSGKNRFHVDHIYPLARGGSNDRYNIQCLCPSCNRKKSAKDPM